MVRRSPRGALTVDAAPTARLCGNSLAGIRHAASRQAVDAERAFLSELGGVHPTRRCPPRSFPPTTTPVPSGLLPVGRLRRAQHQGILNGPDVTVVSRARTVGSAPAPAVGVPLAVRLRGRGCTAGASTVGVHLVGAGLTTWADHRRGRRAAGPLPMSSMHDRLWHELLRPGTAGFRLIDVGKARTIHPGRPSTRLLVERGRGMDDRAAQGRRPVHVRIPGVGGRRARCRRRLGRPRNHLRARGPRLRQHPVTCFSSTSVTIVTSHENPSKGTDVGTGALARWAGPSC